MAEFSEPEIAQSRAAVGTGLDQVGLGGQVAQAADLAHPFLPGTTGATTKMVPSYWSFPPKTSGPPDLYRPMSVPASQSSMTRLGFGALGAMTGVASAVGGYRSATDQNEELDRRVAGGLNVVSGGIGAVGGVAGMVPAIANGTGFLSGLAGAGGAQGLVAPAFSGAAWGAGTGTAMGVGTGIATAGSVLGAGLAGFGLGKLGDDTSRQLPFLEDDHGRPRSISEWGGDKAAAADEWVANKVGGKLGRGLGTTAGVLTSVGTSIAGGALAASAGVAGMLQGANTMGHALADWVTSK